MSKLWETVKDCSLACCSPWGCKKSDIAEGLNNSNILSEVWALHLERLNQPAQNRGAMKKNAWGIFFPKACFPPQTSREDAQRRTRCTFLASRDCQEALWMGKRSLKGGHLVLGRTQRARIPVQLLSTTPGFECFAFFPLSDRAEHWRPMLAHRSLGVEGPQSCRP